MLSHFLSGGDLTSFLILTLLSLPIALLSLSLHEAAHGFVAWRCGDPTARALGRLTLNPLKHLNPLGTLCMLLCGFGWANPVPINSRYFKKPRRDIMLTSLAGPASNLLLAVIFLLLYRFVGFELLFKHVYLAPATTAFLRNVAYYLIIFLQLGISLNVSLALFNLFPVPPLDGSRILFSLLPPRVYFKIMPYERQITIVLMIALLVATYFGWFSALVNLIMQGLLTLVGL
jgi:Zn-dependent protease